MKKRGAIILNSSVVILELVGLGISIFRWGLPIMGYYTQESNLVLLLACILYLIDNIKNHGKVSYLAGLFKYIATCLVAVTFAVVAFAFVPMCIPSMGFGGAFYEMLVKGANLFVHLLCPLLALVSYFGFERDLVAGRKEIALAVIPTFLYAAVAILLNALNLVHGPYPFLYVHEQSVLVSALWFIGILGGGWLFAWLVAKLSKRR